PSGIIVTANQRVVGNDYPYFLSHVWLPPYRARRIFDLLSAKPKLSVDDFRRVEGDVYSIGDVTFARAASKILSEPRPVGVAGGPVSVTGAVATGSTTLADVKPLIADLQSWDGM